MITINKRIFSAVVAGWLITSGAQANIITGRIWENDPTGAGNATIANVPASPPNVTFDANSPLSFNSGSGYTIGAFLGTGGATIISGSGEAGNTLLNTLFDFKGQVTVSNGETFTVTHDDGLTLVIDGNTVISEPGPTGPATDTHTYTGPSGTWDFELVYGECCGSPAVLQISLPLSNVPDHEYSLALLGGAMTLLGVASVRLRK